LFRFQGIVRGDKSREGFFGDVIEVLEFGGVAVEGFAEIEISPLIELMAEMFAVGLG